MKRISIEDQISSQKQEDFKQSTFLNDKNQLFIILIIALYLIIISLLMILGLIYIKNKSVQIVEDMSKNLLIDQIENSKFLNSAVVFQISSQIQKLSWQINLVNQFLGRLLQGQVIKNTQHIPAIYNMNRANFNQDYSQVMQIFQKNKIQTSAWYQVNKSLTNELDQQEFQEIEQSFQVDYIWKSFQLLDETEAANRNMRFYDFFLRFDYDSLLYCSSQNITFQNLQKDSTEQAENEYIGKYHLNIRYVYNFSQIDEKTSLFSFQPEIFELNNSSKMMQTFCQRYLNLTQMGFEKYSTFCLSIDLDFLKYYFDNYSFISKGQVIINSQYNKIIYDSTNFPNTLRPQENKLTKSSAQNLIDQQYIIKNLRKIDLVGFKNENDNQNVFIESQNNNTDIYIIKNMVNIIDKTPSYLFTNSTFIYQIKNVFVILDVVSDLRIIQFSDDLRQKIQNNSLIFLIISQIMILIVFILQVFYSYYFLKSIMDPITKLINILNSAFEQNSQSNQSDQNNNQQFKSERFLNVQNVKIKNQIHQEQIKIDESIQNYLKENELAFEIQELFSNLHDLFKLLRFTTKNTFKEDPSLNLINLCLEIQHFEQFKNNRALGVCYNNIGVIHYNSGRFFESIENFQKSIIYSRYELGFYSHDSKKSLHNFNFSYCEYTSETYQNKYKSQRDIGDKSNKNQQSIQSEKYQIYWSLYNRMQNLVKALGAYILEKKIFSLSDDFQQFVQQMVQVSNKHLPACNKRDMINHYIELVAFKMKNNFEQSFNVLEKFINLYSIKHEIQKNEQIFKKKSPQQKKNSIFYIRSQQSNIQISNDLQSNQKSFVYQNNTFNILMSPIQNKKLDLIRKQWRSQFQKQFNILNYSLQNPLSKPKIKKIKTFFRQFTKKNEILENFQLTSQLKQNNSIEMFNQLDLNEKYTPYFQVRKLKDQEKLCHYQYSSDIFFQFYALEQANFQIKLQNYQTACQILTILFENCVYYLPHLRMQALKILNQIFKINNISNPQLSEIIKKASTLPNSNLKICVISSCQSTFSQFRSYAIQSDLIQDILFKDEDQFCLSTFCFEEEQFFQQIQFTKIQILKSNQRILSQLLKKQIIAIQQFHRDYQTKSNSRINLEQIAKKKSRLKQSLTLKEEQKLSKYSNSIKQSEESKATDIIEIKNFQQLKADRNQVSGSCVQIDSQIKSILFNQINSFQKLDNEQTNKEQLKNQLSSDDNNQSNKIIEFHSKKSLDENFRFQRSNTLQINQSQSIQRWSNTLSSQKNSRHRIQSNSFNSQLKNNNNNSNINNSQIESPKNDNSMFHNDYNPILSNENLLTQSPVPFNHSLSNSQNIFFKKTSLNASCEDQIINQDSKIKKQQQNINFMENQLTQNQISSQQKIPNQKRIHNNQTDGDTIKNFGEKIFHIGIQSALKQFILNTQEKISCYLSRKCFRSYQNNHQEESHQQKIKTYLIYITDQQLEFKNKQLFDQMCQLIGNLEVELLVLNLSKQNQIQEFPDLINVKISSKSLITFFSTEEKLLQYIYNQREHVKNYLYPMVYEHF